MQVRICQSHLWDKSFSNTEFCLSTMFRWSKALPVGASRYVHNLNPQTVGSLPYLGLSLRYEKSATVSFLLSCEHMSHRVAKLHTTPRTLTFWERDVKGGYPSDRINVSRTQLVRDGLKELQQEIKLWKEEIKDKFDSDPVLLYRPGEVDKMWDFNVEKTQEQWVTTADSDHGEGRSSCQLVTSKAGRALFSGNLSTSLPKDGRIKKAGYCNMKSIRARKSFKREVYLDWHAYTHVVLRVRGDGRSYLLNIATMGYYDIMWNDVYHFILFTRGGPYWQVAKIPFSKFFLASKGRVQDKQYPLPLDKVTSLSISVGDKINGPFNLEIDYIGLEFDPTHTEEFAYEMYKMPKYIVAT